MGRVQLWLSFLEGLFPGSREEYMGMYESDESSEEDDDANILEGTVDMAGDNDLDW